ncbi:MAG: molybdopterin-synthase adenylyltransferase MoeB [Chloroflexi bacterium]|nr:molybdopterin-synthase adenylyltransferase MoeB [Chloroflexota bacterium]
MRERANASDMTVNLGFSEEQIHRYSRHILLREIGGKGQRKLMDSSVLIVGAGGLGSSSGLYLAAAGVGRLGFVDNDVVDISNLHRQILHRTSDIGRPKTESAADAVRALNPEVKVEQHQVKLTSANAFDIIAGYDLVVEASDNFPTKYLVNDACVLLGKPLILGAAVQLLGQIMAIAPREGPCYRCLFPVPPPPGTVPTCQEAGVFGPVPGVIGCIQAAEAIKTLVGFGERLVGHLLIYDALTAEFTDVKIERNPSCAVCGDTPTVTGLIDYERFCGER